MKKIYGAFCTIVVTALIGLIVWIHGFFKGMRGAKEAPEEAGRCIDALDHLEDSLDEAFHGDHTGERKGYSTIHAVEDSEEE